MCQYSRDMQGLSTSGGDRGGDFRKILSRGGLGGGVNEFSMTQCQKSVFCLNLTKLRLI